MPLIMNFHHQIYRIINSKVMMKWTKNKILNFLFTTLDDCSLLCLNRL